MSEDLSIRARAVLDVVPMLDVLRVLGASREIHGDGTQQIRCPLHDDRRPSARLYVGDHGEPTKIYCFTCSKNFDVIDLVRTKHRLTFAGAIDWLEAHFTIPLPSCDLATRVAANLRRLPPASTAGMATVAEGAIAEGREHLGLERSTKAWLALDLALYRHTAGQLDAPGVQMVVQKIVEVARGPACDGTGERP